VNIFTNLIEDNIKGYLSLDKKVFPFSLLVSVTIPGSGLGKQSRVALNPRILN
jgi:hypothetical protein